jgi:hypothetical protein
MRTAFSKLFWGFLIILLEIHIFVIDVLPDPIGYIMICSSLSYFVDEYKTGGKARGWAIVLVIFSIPSIFIPQSIISESSQFLSGWSIYHMLLGLLKLILVFHIFQILIVIAKNRLDTDIYNYTNNFFIIYMIIVLGTYIITPFHMNLQMDTISWFITLIHVVAFIIEIMFLVLIHKFKRLN